MSEGQRYGFYGRLTRDFPSQIFIDTTELCNLACIHCPHEQFKKSKYYSGASLSPELNAKAVDEVRQYGSEYIRYSAEGETLLNKHFFEMLDYATHNAGSALITTTTNGTLLDKKRIEQLLKTGVHAVDISIDAHTPKTYAKIRVHGDLNITRTNVLNLLKAAQNTKTKIVVSYIEQEENKHETADFEKFWKDHGAAYVVVRRLHSGSGTKEKIAQEMRTANEKLPRRPCVYPWERIGLNPCGFLTFCPVDWTHSAAFIDYRTTTIKEVWQKEFYQKLRQAHLSNDFSQHPFCGQCPDWSTVRWPDEGRAYADMVKELKESR